MLLNSPKQQKWVDIEAKEIIAADCGYMNPENEPEMITSDFEKWMTKIFQSDHCRTEMYEGEKVMVLNNMYHAIDYLKSLVE